jgi:hypothetical protein
MSLTALRRITRELLVLPESRAGILLILAWKERQQGGLSTTVHPTRPSVLCPMFSRRESKHLPAEEALSPTRLREGRRDADCRINGPHTSTGSTSNGAVDEIKWIMSFLLLLVQCC